MKITLVLGQEQLPNPRAGGGVITLVHALAAGFSSAGNSVCVISANSRPADAPDSIQYISVKGCRRHPSAALNFLRGLPYACRVARQLNDSDIVSCHNLHSFAYPMLTQAKVVTHTVHRAPKDYMRLYGLTDRVYSGSPSIVSELKAMNGSLNKKAKCIYNFVDYSGYAAAEQAIVDKSITFMYVGRFTADKGLDCLVKGFISAYANGCPNIKLRLLGPKSAAEGSDPIFVSNLVSCAKGSPACAAISFEDPIYDRNQLEAEMRKSTVICLPSLGGETLNMTMLEALRLSKPLIVSDLPANEPLIRLNETGLVAKRGDSDSWARAFEKFSSKVFDIGMMSAKAFEFGKSKFSKEIVIADYIADFENLLGQNSRLA